MRAPAASTLVAAGVVFRARSFFFCRKLSFGDEPRTPDNELILNIGYGLKRAETCRCARVLAYLILAGFEFTCRLPKEKRGSALREGSA